MESQPEAHPIYDQIAIFQGHSGWVRSVAFSPNGHHLASASHDQTIQLFEVQPGGLSLVKTLTGHSNRVNSVAFSPSAQLLASASSDDTIRIWDTSSGVHISTLNGHTGWVLAVAFSMDGSCLASASLDGTIRLWEPTSGYHIATFEAGIAAVYCAAFSADGTQLACGSTDSIHIWEISSRSEVAVWKGHTKPLNSIAFSQDGSLFASGSDDKTVRLWDARSGTHLATLEGHTDWVRVVAFSPDGRVLASTSDDGTIRLWGVESRSYISTLVATEARSLAFSADGSLLAGGFYNGEVWLWKRTDHAIIEPMLIDSHPNGDTNTLQKLQNLNISSISSAAYASTVFANNDISSLVSILDNNRIGSGGFGELFLGTHRRLGKVAMKRPHVLLNDTPLRRFLREVELWCSMSHRYILPCLGTCKIGREVYMVSPFIENGDLMSCMQQGIAFDRSRLLYEVAEALAHLHHRGIVHGDVKAQNVLLSDDGSALLCDFGLAKAFDTMVTSTEAKGTGSSRWMPPELLNGESRSMASDVYSFGITIAEVLSGHPPFSNLTDNVAVIVHVLLRNGRPPKEPMTSPEGRSYSLLWETAEKCWATDPKDRPHMAQVLGMLFPLTREKSSI